MWTKLNITFIILVHSAAAAGQTGITPPAVILQGHLYKVNHICYNRTGDLLASCGWDNTVRLWDMNTQTEIYVLRGHKDNVWTVKFSPDGKYLAIGTSESDILIWDMNEILRQE